MYLYLKTNDGYIKLTPGQQILYKKEVYQLYGSVISHIIYPHAVISDDWKKYGLLEPVLLVGNNKKILTYSKYRDSIFAVIPHLFKKDVYIPVKCRVLNRKMPLVNKLRPIESI
jgi:hypothetical protein